LPRLTRIAEHAVDPRRGEPAENGERDKLGAVVAAQRAGGAVRADELGEHLDHAPRANATRDVDRQRFARVFVDHRQALELLAIRARVEDEIIGPYLVGAGGPRRLRARAGHAAARPFAWHLELR